MLSFLVLLTLLSGLPFALCSIPTVLLLLLLRNRRRLEDREILTSLGFLYEVRCFNYIRLTSPCTGLSLGPLVLRAGERVDAHECPELWVAVGLGPQAVPVI